MRKVKNIYSIFIGIGIGSIILAAMVLFKPSSFEVAQAKPVDFEKYIEERDIETEVLGVSYPVAKYEPCVPELTEMEMTYYTDYGTCADGVTKAHEGVCAVQKDLIGMTAIIYSMDDELIGIYECCDTGFGREESNGKGTIQNGHCIDVYMDSDSDGKKLIKEHGNKVKVQFVEAEG